jgi:hypothetical protein
VRLHFVVRGRLRFAFVRELHQRLPDGIAQRVDEHVDAAKLREYLRDADADADAAARARDVVLGWQHGNPPVEFGFL